ncbi:hypothetical protein BGX27_009679, partial [Mortierella sp. AM989]
INSSQVRSQLDPITLKEQTSLLVKPSPDRSLSPPYKELGDQRTHSAAMGPMGANENHGSQRAKPAQETTSYKSEIVENGRAGPYQSKDGRRKEDEDEEDELEEDEHMEGHEYGSEENVDELMDEEGPGESNDSESFQGQAYYSQQQQQFLSHSSRSLQNILPRPSSGGPQPDHGPGHGYDSMTRDRTGTDPTMSSWDPHTSKDMPRQGAPRNNRPLQVRPIDTSDLSSDYTKNNGSNNSSKNGTSAGHSAEITTEGGAASNTLASNANVVNNGSSKKRTTPAKHKCPQCDKYFTRPFNLKSHQRTHTQERPFVCSFLHCCPECHRNFVRQDALTRHLRLDFGHNRCSGYPGPLPGASANQDKSDDSEDEAMGDSPTEASPRYSAPKAEGGSATVQAGPSFKSPSSPTSPTLASPIGQGHSRSEIVDTESERSASSTLSVRDNRIAPKPSQNTELGHTAQDLREDGEQISHRDLGPHSRHSSSNVAPISFVHRSTPAERRTLTPPNSNERPSFLSQHSRSFSHSAFSQGQHPTLPPTSNILTPQSSGPGSSNDFSNAERRISPTNSRNGTSWPTQGHDPSNMPADSHHQSLAPGRQLPPPHVLTRPDALKSVSYGSEFDRMRPLPHSLPEHPSSPQEVRRSPPPNHPADWSASGPDSSRPWNWDSRQQEARHRHPSWNSAPSPTSRGPLSTQHSQDQAPQSPSVPLPRGPNGNSWQRGPPPPSLAREEPAPRDSREGPIRVPSRLTSSYPNSPYQVEPSMEHHIRPPSSVSQAMARPIESYRRPDLERDPRQRSMSEIDRMRGSSMSWSEQRSRSFHELDSGIDARPRFESHPHSPQHAREGVLAGRPSVVEALPSVPERPHVYSGMVGAERYQNKSYHERDLPRENGANSVKSPIAKDPMSRDFRPTRSHSTMEYESDRETFHRQPRYSGEPNTSPREARRSMSPISSERFSGTEAGRPSYDGIPRYPYSGDRSDQYNREDPEKMSNRQFRHDERPMVMSPLPRDEQGGYYGEPVRHNSYRASQGYPQSQQRPQEPSHRHLDELHDPARRERHSIDMPLASPSSTVGPPPPKRQLTAATVTTR